METRKRNGLKSILSFRQLIRVIGRIFSSEEKKNFEKLKDYIAS